MKLEQAEDKSTSTDLKDRFASIYASDEWSHGSGPGSIPEQVSGYMRVLQTFLRDHQIKSVVDLGCGDWQFSQYIDWSGIQYTGFDIVPSVIERNQATFSKPNVHFELFDGRDFSRLPSADLLISKDVLQHWSNKSVHEFLPTLKRYRYCLITNCINPRGRTRNIDIVDGGYRYLDLRLPPFNVAATELYVFQKKLPFWRRPFRWRNWKKRVLLISSDNGQTA